MSRLIDVAAVLDRMANALRGTEQGEACAFAVKLMRERESMTDEAQELAEALEELYNTTASLRFDAKGRHGWKFVAETSAWKLNTVALVKAEQLVLARHRAKQEVQS